MATSVTMKQHDLLPSFQVQLLDDTSPVDLSSALAARFLMYSRKTGLKVSGSMTILDQSVAENLGIVRYDWVTGDTDTVATYAAEIEVTWPGTPNKPETYPGDSYINVVVKQDLGP